MIETARTTSDSVNQVEVKIWKTWSRSSASTIAGAEDRVVAVVDLGHRGRVVGRRAEGERRQLADGHPDDGEQRQDDDLGDREVDRRQQAPDRATEPGRRIQLWRAGAGEGRGRTGDRTAPSGAAGAGVGGDRRGRGGVGRRGAEPAARAASRPRSKSATRSSRSSSPTETRSRPAVIPASARAASSSWRWVVDGGWTTIVKTLPSDAVSSGIVEARR